MSRFTVHHGDCLAILPTLPEASVDSIVTDPPYGLSFMGKDWDHGIPGEAFWREALRVAKPGAFLLAFGGTRTFHRLTCAIEDAGWEVRDCIMWVYGSGFPKSHNLKGAWQGWGTALKPAWEPIIVARKPLCGTVADNVLKYGTGAMNVDWCRVETEDSLNGGAYCGDGDRASMFGLGNTGKQFNQPSGRWPANLIHDGSEEVVGLFPQTTSGSRSGSYANGTFSTGTVDRALNGSTGSAARFFYCAKASKRDRDEGLDKTCTVKYIVGGSKKGDPPCKDVSTVLVSLLKMATSESVVRWNIGECGESIMGRCPSDSLSTTVTEISRITESKILSLLTPSLISDCIADASCGTANGGSLAGSAVPSRVSQAITTQEKLEELARGVRDAVSPMLSEISDSARWSPARNIHSTVKPTDLMRYLCRLVTQPGGTVLDPFTGSGSTGKAAMLEGLNFIGCELSEEYVKIAEARISDACNRVHKSAATDLLGEKECK